MISTKINKQNTPFYTPRSKQLTHKIPQASYFCFLRSFWRPNVSRWDYLSYNFQVFRNRTLNWWSVVDVNCSVKRFGCYYVSAESLLCPWNPWSIQSHSLWDWSWDFSLWKFVLRLAYNTVHSVWIIVDWWWDFWKSTHLNIVGVIIMEYFFSLSQK